MIHEVSARRLLSVAVPLWVYSIWHGMVSRLTVDCRAIATHIPPSKSSLDAASGRGDPQLPSLDRRPLQIEVTEHRVKSAGGRAVGGGREEVAQVVRWHGLV